MMHKKFQMSYMSELVFFLGLQVKQKEDGIFINQDKYVTETLKKFGFKDVKTASTPMETHTPLIKDADGEDIDEHMYRSMIGSLMYLTSSRPDIMFAVCVCAKFQVNPKVSHLHAVKRIFRYLKGSPQRGLSFLRCRLISWQCKKQTMVANSTTENEKDAKDEIRKGIGVNVGNSKLMLLGINLLLLEKVNAARHNLLLLVLQALVDGKKMIITESKIRRDLQLKDAKALEEISEGSASPINPHHTPIITQPSTSQPQKKQKLRKPKRKDTKAPQPSGPTTNVADEAFSEENVIKHPNDPLLNGEDSMKLEELMELCTNLQQRVIDLETTKTTQGTSLGDQEDASKQGRKIDDIDADARITLVDETQGRHDDDLITADPVTTAGEVVTAANVEVSTASPTAATITTVELTLAQTLAELKSARPKTKGVGMQEPSESITTTTTIPSKEV
ncbi:uncharacterized mitochondrial protein-like protein [Tanacetum coccineum]